MEPHVISLGCSGRCLEGDLKLTLLPSRCVVDGIVDDGAPMIESMSAAHRGLDIEAPGKELLCRNVVIAQTSYGRAGRILLC